ncbi:hypothetical protein [Microbacterium sp. SS28]|uniref:hypothetical protein n=1 Tax=Microbacterium sp. SS28 TaxID=2919948 RepID=UPI001FA9E4EA|nr:hypothetical protein [Microbacterium sp. SS28]
MARSPLAALGAVLFAGLLLAGCASQTGDATPTEPAEETTSAPDLDPDLGAAWLDNGRMIGLVTLGSSTCIPQAEEAVVKDGALQVTLVEPDADEPCTADLVPRVTLVGVPADVDPAQNLPIVVTGLDYRGEVELAGVEGLTPGDAGTDYLPSAGWATVQGQFVVLTWGSSSCAPVISDVAATGPAEVTVTYETPPADQVCTMDMAPRAVVTAVNGLEENSGVEAILTGGEFDNVRIPIYGVNA